MPHTASISDTPSISNTSVGHYAVFGNPIAHSKSPQIHALFARQTSQNMDYIAQQVPLDQFETAVSAFMETGGKGLNITVPFKEKAWAFADTHSERAQRAGAVNTLIKRDNGELYGDNTDVVGLARDLILNHKIPVEARNILLIGAGGAIRGILEALLEQQPTSLLIANRTKPRAIELMNDFADMGNINGCGLNELGQQTFDIVINGTAASLHGKLPALPDELFNPHACSYDLMYSARPTPFMRWSKQHGAEKIFDGLGMLVEQAAESFFLWRNVKPDTETVINIIRHAL